MWKGLAQEDKGEIRDAPCEEAADISQEQTAKFIVTLSVIRGFVQDVLRMFVR